MAFFLLLLPTFGHANIALTGKSFQALLKNETITGYELTKNYNPSYNPYNPGGGSLYSYSGKPVYYDPYKPEVVRSLQAVDDAPIKYPSKVKVKDLIGMKDINGKKIFTVPQSGVYTGMTCARGIATKALTGAPSFMLMELVFPETLADGTIKSSGYEFGKISDAADSEITAAEMQARIALNNGVPVNESFTGLDGNYYYYGGKKYSVNPVVSPFGVTAFGAANGYPAIYFRRSSTVNYLSYDPLATYLMVHDGGGSYHGHSVYGMEDAPPSFDPLQYPDLYSGSQGDFNALAELVANDAEIELIPLDPALMPTYFPDTDTGFMRFSGRTEIGGDDYLLGPDYTAVLNPPGVTWSGGFPYVDPASIGLIADPTLPGGQTTIIPSSITGIPAGSKILSVDPQTGLVKFQTPEGSESSKYLSPEEIQNIQNKVASPYLDQNGLPINYGEIGTEPPSNSTISTVQVQTDPQDYKVTVPGLPGVPNFPSDFEVPAPDPWPWASWVSNPIKTILDNMEITAAGSPYLNFPIEFPWYEPFSITIDFSEYETEISTIGGYMVALAYFMAVLFVVRAKN